MPDHPEKAPVLIDGKRLDELSAEAAMLPRRRKNLNFHHSEVDVAQRLLIAIEPGSYVVPHRHLDPNKDETLIVLRGRLGVVIFDAEGQILKTAMLEGGAAENEHGGLWGIDIPHGFFHTVVSCQPGTVFFESKGGPYVPLMPEEFAPWAPAEGSEEAMGYARTLEGFFAARGMG